MDEGARNLSRAVDMEAWALMSKTRAIEEAPWDWTPGRIACKVCYTFRSVKAQVEKGERCAEGCNGTEASSSKDSEAKFGVETGLGCPQGKECVSKLVLNKTWTCMLSYHCRSK